MMCQNWSWNGGELGLRIVDERSTILGRKGNCSNGSRINLATVSHRFSTWRLQGVSACCAPCTPLWDELNCWTPINYTGVVDVEIFSHVRDLSRLRLLHKFIIATWLNRKENRQRAIEQSNMRGVDYILALKQNIEIIDHMIPNEVEAQSKLEGRESSCENNSLILAIRNRLGSPTGYGCLNERILIVVNPGMS